VTSNETTEKCYWCGGDHDPKNCPIADQEKLRRCYQAIAGPLIEGDYIGPLRGEVQICLNVINYHKAFEEACRELLGYQTFRKVQDRAYQIRRDKYGKLLW
jgi:hypothetical protein